MNHVCIEEYIMFERNYVYRIDFAVAIIIMTLISIIIIKNEFDVVGVFIVGWLENR